jgi:hypothetical protein
VHDHRHGDEGEEAGLSRPGDGDGAPPVGGRELRVHGVAGTPPESMLGLRAVLDGSPGGAACVRRPGPDEITLWDPPRIDPRLQAWSWSSLTSGRWYQAFYLLLLPFMIANLAGWMLPAGRPDAPGGPAPYRDLRLRWATLVVRLVGLLVTLVFVVSVQIVLADLVVWQWLHRRLDRPVGIAGIGTAATAAVFLLLIVLTHIRPRPATATGRQLRPFPWSLIDASRERRAQWRTPRDPVGAGFLVREQWLLWNSGAINVALRRLHLTAGLATIALLAAVPLGRAEPSATDAIGGEIDGVELANALDDRCGRKHSDYWVEDEYGEAAARLRAMLARDPARDGHPPDRSDAPAPAEPAGTG